MSRRHSPLDQQHSWTKCTVHELHRGEVKNKAFGKVCPEKETGRLRVFPASSLGKALAVITDSTARLGPAIQQLDPGEGPQQVPALPVAALACLALFPEALQGQLQVAPAAAQLEP